LGEEQESQKIKVRDIVGIERLPVDVRHLRVILPGLVVPFTDDPKLVVAL